jgi:hypothetical protein
MVIYFEIDNCLLTAIAKLYKLFEVDALFSTSRFTRLPSNNLRFEADLNKVFILHCEMQPNSQVSDNPQISNNLHIIDSWKIV